MANSPRPANLLGATALRSLALALGGTLAVLAALFLGTAHDARADTVITTCTGTVIQAALSAGGVVTFNCGGPVTVPIAQTLVVSRTVTLDGGNAVTLDGQGLTRILSVTVGSALTLTNITLVNGNAADGRGGGGVHVGMTGTLLSLNTVYTTNRALTGPLANGGAVFGEPASTLDIRGSTFLSNTAANNGGAAFAPTATVSGSTFLRNTAVSFGGAVAAGTTTISGSTFLSNTATAGGAVDATTVTISGSTFVSNTATAGGAVQATTVTISGSTFLSNTASNGGAVGGSLVTINGSTLENNTANTGGAVQASFVTLSGSTLENNTASFGGAVGASTLTINGSTFLGNTAILSGGVVDATFLTISGSTFVSNTASRGGAVAASAATIENSTLVSNAASLGGGAVFFGTTLVLTNATVVANGAATFSSTAATRPFTLTDSIVAGPGSPLCAYPATLKGVNVIEGTSCGTIGIINAAPLLGPLQDNGGPTWTAAPLPGSPAIGAAGFCLPTDQRGAVRTAPCDVGAYETGAAPALTALLPPTGVALSPAFVLTGTGSGFLTGTVALWNGSPRSTTVLNSTTLTVTIPASDLAASGVVLVAARYGLAADSLSTSLPFTITKASQTITFAPLPDRAVGDPPFTVAATASSGLPVAFTASGTCSVAGALVTVTGTGSCTITASQPGDATYNPAAPVGQTFMVRPVMVYIPAAFAGSSSG
jgi:predicted outer membrane repeat protein